MISYGIYPGGKKKAVTMSYDDGVIQDVRLIEVFDKYNIRGTFHLNSGIFGKGNRNSEDKIKEIYKNHEISVHGVKHETLANLPVQNIIHEIFEDRKALEKIAGYPVRGMSYANGSFNDTVCDTLKVCGIVYSRTTHATGGFALPDDFLKWHPTCHHRDSLECIERFNNLRYDKGHLLYIWGHAYEFDNNNNWDLIEEACKRVSGHEHVWYATNIEVYDYIMAQRSLHISADNKIIYNPSAISVWVVADGEPLEIKSGETVTLF